MIKHLACIMDGNRRWALQQGLISFYGHKKGFDAVKTVIDFCLKKEIPYLSLYAFSIENLKRTAQERYYLFEVLAPQVAQEIESLKEKNIRVRFSGDRALFPDSIRFLCENIEQKTQHCTGLLLNFLVCYGGQQEIADAARRIAVKVKAGDLDESDVTPDLFENFLWTAGIPRPDLIIRTGGYQRLSNFLLFQGAYSEIYFLDCLWPDISCEDLEKAATHFYHCQKNFGQ